MEDRRNVSEGQATGKPRWALDLGEAFRIYANVQDDYTTKIGSSTYDGELNINQASKLWSNFSTCISTLRTSLPNEIYVGERKPAAPIHLNFAGGGNYATGFNGAHFVYYFLPKDNKVLEIEKSAKVDPSYIPESSEYQGISRIVFPTKKGLPYGVRVYKRRLSPSEQKQAFKGMGESLKGSDKEDVLQGYVDNAEEIIQKFEEEKRREEEFFAQQKKMRILNILRIFKQDSQIAGRLPHLISSYINIGGSNVSEMHVVLDTEKEEIFRAPMITEEKKTFLRGKRVVKRLDLTRQEPSQVLDWHAVDVSELLYLLPHGKGREYVDASYRKINRASLRS